MPQLQAGSGTLLQKVLGWLRSMLRELGTAQVMEARPNGLMNTEI